MNIQRLKMHIAFMRALPSEASKHFDMTTWLEHSGGHPLPGVCVGRVVQMETLMDCGTAACAIGWAGVNPLFKKKERIKMVSRGVGSSPRFLIGNGKELLHPDSAAMAFFDLTERQNDVLFGPLSYIKTPQQWADHAEKVIANWEALQKEVVGLSEKPNA